MAVLSISVTVSIFICSGFINRNNSAQTAVAAADTIPAPKADTTITESPEVEPSVNKQAWISHLEKNLQPVVESAAAAGMKTGTYTVNVRFVVEKDGSISHVKALNDPGYGVARGAVRVVKTGPEWEPGKLNGMTIRSFHTQAITFVITK